MALSRVRSALPFAAIGMAALLLAALLVTVCTSGVSLAVSVDGKPLGAVSDAEYVQKIEDRVNGDLKDVAHGLAECDSDIRYYFVHGSDCEDKASGEDIYYALYTKALEDYKTAYGLFVDGKFVAANESLDVINNVLNDIKADLEDEIGAGVELSSSLEVVGKYYHDSALKADNEMFALIKESCSYEAVLGDTDIMYGEDETDAFAPGPSIDITVSDSAVTSYRVSVVETVPYTTVYEKSSSLYVGDYEKLSDGVDGKTEFVYEVTLKDGVEVSRELVAENVIVQMEEKVIREGTKARPSTASTGSFIWPMDEGTYYISSRYGGRRLYGKYNFHSGLDMAGDRGENIYAADGGLVTTVGRHSSYGIYVVITHDNGYMTLYAHLSEATAVQGERVFQGEKIGEVGRTGLATGYHLHFEVRYNGERLDPEEFLPR